MFPSVKVNPAVTIAGVENVNPVELVLFIVRL